MHPSPHRCSTKLLRTRDSLYKPQHLTSNLTTLVGTYYTAKLNSKDATGRLADEKGNESRTSWQFYCTQSHSSNASTRVVLCTCGILDRVPCGKPNSLSQAIDVEGVVPLQLPLCCHARQGSVPQRWLGPFRLSIDVRKECLHVCTSKAGTTHPPRTMMTMRMAQDTAYADSQSLKPGDCQELPSLV